MSESLISGGSFKRNFARKLDQTDLFWLAYLIFFVIEPIERHSTRYWLENVGILVFFLGLYVAFLKASACRIHVALVACMVLLGAITLPFNGGAAAFIIYGAALLPFVLDSPTWVFTSLAAEVLLLTVECHLLHFNYWQIFMNCFFTLVVGFTNFHFGQKQRADSKLRMKQEEIEALAAVAERERIARDLHDVLGHTLSVIVLKAELAGRLLDRELATPIAENASSSPVPTQEVSSQPHPSQELSSSPDPAKEVSSRPERDSFTVPRSGETRIFDRASAEGASLQPTNLARARAEIGEVERTARTALGEVREAIGGYRARGLGAEIEAARETLATAGVTLTTEGDLKPAGLTAAEETVLALALREAVTNIVRHAHATTCRLRLVVERGHHRLSIQDNGRNAGLREGNGLRGMRERVESLGGQLSLTREAGTHLLIELPPRAGIAT